MIRILSLGIVLVLVSCSGEDTNKGDQYFAKGDFKKALAAYNSYLESNASDTKTLYNRGRAYQELNKLDQAEKDFLAVIQADDKNLNAHLSLSKLYYAKELYNKAVLWADKAIELNENSAQGHFLAARAKHQLGYVKPAMESYTLAIKVDGGFGEAYLYRGALKLGQGNTTRACEDFKKANALEVAEAKGILGKYCK